MTEVHEQHQARGVRQASVAVITASDSRTLETDDSGKIIQTLVTEAGHQVVRYLIVKDELVSIRRAVKEAWEVADVVLLNGGTGVGPRDVSVEAVRPLLDKSLEGFGELFRAMSFQEIGSAAMMSRALAGVRGEKIVFVLPGSPAACSLALTRLILPELGHLLAMVRP